MRFIVNIASLSFKAKLLFSSRSADFDASKVTNSKRGITNGIQMHRKQKEGRQPGLLLV